MKLSSLEQTIYDTAISCHKTNEEAMEMIIKTRSGKNPKKKTSQYTYRDFGSVMDVVQSFRKSPEEERAIRRWDKSPFRHIREAAPNPKGRMAEAITQQILSSLGHSTFLKSGKDDFDILVDGVRVEIKSSTLNQDDGFTFNAMVYEKCDEFCLIGIEPHRIRVWRLHKDVAKEIWGTQGKLGGNNQISFKNNKVPSILSSHKIFDKEFRND